MSGIMQIAASIFAAAAGPPGPSPTTPGNLGTITVASQPYSDGIDFGTSYGAASGAIDSSRFPAFGTVTGGTQILVNVDVGGGFTQLNIADGSYTGFTVTNGAVDGDTSNSQYFTVDGTTTSFTIASTGVGTYKYLASGDPFGLTSKLGQTLAVDLVVPGVFLFGDITVGTDGIIYGWDQYGSVGSSTISYPPDASNGIYYRTFGSYTRIELQPGTYYGVVIDGGTNTVDGGNTITATIGGVSSMLTVGNMLRADVAGDPFDLQSKNGQTLAVSVVAGGTPPPPTPGQFVSGNMTVGTVNEYGTDFWGWDPYGITPYGSATIPTPPTGPTLRIIYSTVLPGGGGNGTQINFISGTYGNIVVDGSAATIDGETSVTVTIDSVVQTGTLVTVSGGCKLFFAGDVFSLQSKNGQTLAVTMDAGGGGATTTYTANTDYSTSGSGGMQFTASGPPNTYNVSLNQFNWSNVAGYTALSNLTSGNTFAVTMPLSGSTSYTITLSSSWSGGGGSLSTVATANSSLPLSGGSTNIPSTITVTTGGGGGGTTYTSSGNWSSSGLYNYGSWQVNLNLTTASAELLAALNALTIGSTFSVTDGVYSPTVTVQNISGQPFSQFSYVTINVGTPSPMPPVNLTMLTSITI